MAAILQQPFHRLEKLFPAMRKILQSRLFLSHLIKRSRILCQKAHFITKLQQIAGKRAVNAAQEIDMGCGKQLQILLGSFPVFVPCSISL